MSREISGIPGMLGEITRRYALPDLHGSKPGHRLVPLRTRRCLFGLRSSLRALPIVPRRHRLLPDDIPPDRADAHRQAQSETAVRNDRACVQQAAVGRDKRANHGQRGVDQQQYLRTPSSQAQAGCVREIPEDRYLSRSKGVLRYEGSFIRR